MSKADVIITAMIAPQRVAVMGIEWDGLSLGWRSRGQREDRALHGEGQVGEQ